jgi:hypothetical protein
VKSFDHLNVDGWMCGEIGKVACKGGGHTQSCAKCNGKA